MKLAELPQVLALSPAEKLDLIDELWESVEAELDDPEISDDEKRLLDERWKEHLADPDKALTLEQLQEALDQRLK
jgi:putative addiction module component (TIGR02574 family)